MGSWEQCWEGGIPAADMPEPVHARLVSFSDELCRVWQVLVVDESRSQHPGQGAQEPVQVDSWWSRSTSMLDKELAQVCCRHQNSPFPHARAHHSRLTPLPMRVCPAVCCAGRLPPGRLHGIARKRLGVHPSSLGMRYSPLNFAQDGMLSFFARGRHRKRWPAGCDRSIATPACVW